MNLISTINIIFHLLTIVVCNNEFIPKSEDPMKALSRSKASVWVDTNKGSVFSTSLGSSHVEKGNRTSNAESVGRSSNMLLTLLLQPTSQMAISPVQPPTEAQESHLKPILLLLQQQQDLSELLLEKQEKVEKMNVHLQQQVKHQQLLIVDLLEQIKRFLEVINSPIFSSQSSSETNNRLRNRGGNDLHHTSASSSANAIVTIPKKRAQQNPKNNSTQNSNDVLTFPKGKIPPILVWSQSETVEYLRPNLTVITNPTNLTNQINLTNITNPINPRDQTLAQNVTTIPGPIKVL